MGNIINDYHELAEECPVNRIALWMPVMVDYLLYLTLCARSFMFSGYYFQC